MSVRKVFSYIVAKDGGYSPNPFHGVCTLACCKPKVRRSARPGDLIIGLTAKSRGHRLVYGMIVSEQISFAQYWHDSRFAVKRPIRGGSQIQKLGDNHYEPVASGGYRQHLSVHSFKDRENPANKRRDLGEDHSNPVLIANEFCYFGGDAIPLPMELHFIAPGRGHRCRFSTNQVDMVWRWFQDLPRGLLGRPAIWEKDDSSWQVSASAGSLPSNRSTRTAGGPGCSA